MSEITPGTTSADVVTVLASTPLPLLLTTTDARIVFANRAAQRLLGVSSGDVTGRFLAEFAGPPHGRVRRLAAVASGAAHPVTALLTLVASRRRRVGVRVVVARGQAADGDHFLTWQVTTAPMAHALPEIGPETPASNGSDAATGEPEDPGTARDEGDENGHHYDRWTGAEDDEPTPVPAGVDRPAPVTTAPAPTGAERTPEDRWWSLALELSVTRIDRPVPDVADQLVRTAAAVVGRPLRLEFSPGPKAAPVAAASDPVVALAAQVEAENGGGPSSPALRGHVVVVPDLVHDDRLGPAGPALAERLGLRSLVATPIQPSDGAWGVLVGYAEDDAAFAEDDVARLGGIARILGTVLESAVRLQSATVEVNQLRTAMSSRAVIEQGKGMLMAAGKMDADAAFAQLRARSQAANRRLRDVAAELVEAWSGSAGPDDEGAVAPADESAGGRPRPGAGPAGDPFAGPGDADGPPPGPFGRPSTQPRGH